MKYKGFFVRTFSKMCFILRCFLRPGSSWRSLSCKKSPSQPPIQALFPFWTQTWIFHFRASLPPARHTAGIYKCSDKRGERPRESKGERGREKAKREERSYPTQTEYMGQRNSSGVVLHVLRSMPRTCWKHPGSPMFML